MRTGSGTTDRTRTPRRPRREVVEEPQAAAELTEVAPPVAAEQDEAPEANERPSVPSQNTLAQLMRKAIAGRRRMTEAQDKLREMELEIRKAEGDERTRFERLRAAALDEYRSARMEAERARRQLASSLKLLPGRQDGRSRGAEAA